ncbi:putative clathrin assembly protein [Sesamum angolense]|uniref:Clathrin assembly protein n=1 Tax=Sesamum angolense TaxID=2727404 RepID=A0AAE2BY05_9LAMI|nr:putative clathrin assembly protein [Sesamum angolense]
MAPSKFRQAIGAVKDKTSIGLAKVASNNSLSDLDVAIVKATRHEELPPDERYIREILSMTAYSRAFVNACINTIARRLNKTKNWVVALKTLMLVQRLLAEGDPAYEQEIFFATRRGTRLLNMSDFRDTSGKSYAWDYSAFVRTYALYLDEQLEFRMQGRRGKRVVMVIHRWRRKRVVEAAPAQRPGRPLLCMK